MNKLDTSRVHRRREEDEDAPSPYDVLWFVLLFIGIAAIGTLT